MRSGRICHGGVQALARVHTPALVAQRSPKSKCARACSGASGQWDSLSMASKELSASDSTWSSPRPRFDALAHRARRPGYVTQPLSGSDACWPCRTGGGLDQSGTDQTARAD